MFYYLFVFLFEINPVNFSFFEIFWKNKFIKNISIVISYLLSEFEYNFCSEFPYFSLYLSHTTSIFFFTHCSLIFFVFLLFRLCFCFSFEFFFMSSFKYYWSVHHILISLLSYFIILLFFYFTIFYFRIFSFRIFYFFILLPNLPIFLYFFV